MKFLALAFTVMSFYTLAEGTGAMVIEIKANLAMDKSGIKVGDIIQDWSQADSKEPTSTLHWNKVILPYDLERLRGNRTPTESISLRIDRNGSTQIMKLGKQPLGVTLLPIVEMEIVEEYKTINKLVDKQKTLALEKLSKKLDKLAASWFLSEAFTISFRLKQIERGNNLFEQALKKIEGSEHATDSLINWTKLLGAKSRWQGGYYDDSHKVLIEVLETLSNATNNNLIKASALELHGRVYTYQGKFEQANKFLQQAYDLQQSVIPDSLNQGETLHSMGNSAFWKGDIDSAESRYQEALTIRKSIAESSSEHGSSIMALGNIEWRRGDLEQAEKLFLESLAIRQKLSPEGLLTAGDLTMLGHVAYDRTEYQRAKKYYSQSLLITRKNFPGDETVANTLMGLGNTSRRLSNLNAALNYHTEAREIYEKLGSKQRLTLVLNNLANVVKAMGDLEMAESYHRQGIKLKQEQGASDLNLAVSWYNLAGISRKRKNFDEARRLFKKALKPFRQNSPGKLQVQATVFSLGEVELEASQDLELTKIYFKEALMIAEKLAPGTMYEAEVLHRLGKLAVLENQFQDALDYFNRAVTAFESQRLLIGGNADTARNFASKFDYLYKDLAELLIRLKHPQQVFSVIERYRARILMAMSLGRQQDIEHQATTETAKQWQASRKKYNKALTLLLRASISESKKIKAHKKNLAHARTELESAGVQYHALSPQRAAIDYPQQIPLQELLTTLSTQEVVLSYLVSEKNVYLLVAKKSEQSISQTLKLDIKPQQLSDEIQSFMTLLRVQNPNQVLTQALRKKSNWLYNKLVHPAENFLKDNNHIIILADGSLHGLPFSALTINSSEEANPEYLIEGHQLQLAPSLHWLYTTRKLTKQKTTLKIAAFADPLPIVVANTETEDDSIYRTGAFPPLYAAQQEVEKIAELFENTDLFLGKDATEQNVKNISGKKLNILHFATHAVVNNEFPLDSFLVLGRHSTDGENGLLQAREIVEEMEFDTDLVVLSACNTALGKLSAGEGITGLTSSFLYSGARNVISTFWSVSDRNTSDLMQQFYVELNDSKTPAEALRNSQLMMIERSRKISSGFFPWWNKLVNSSQPDSKITPADWAAFQLYGNNQ